jgi:TM2 domain-containing membrane protein YozV
MGNTHSVLIGYLTWIFGFTGAHRFYYGRPISGTIYFFTFGLFCIGWFVDLFLIPSMNRSCDHRYESGEVNYDVAWILLAWLGAFGVDRFYLGKVGTGMIELSLAILVPWTFGLAAIPLALFQLYDLWTMNEQISEVNRRIAYTRQPVRTC